MNIIRKRLEIHLLSDMCCGTGEGNGSSIDQLTAVDETGLPYIPAKRLKGLLREQAEFLVDYGNISRDTLIKLFGGLNGREGTIRVDNAVIENYEQLLRVLPGIASAAEVTGVFCSAKAQTAINEAGIAKRGSLRITQVVNKNHKFIAMIAIIDGDSEMLELLENSVKTLRHIGANKTRGYGEVKCVLLNDSTSDNICGTFDALDEINDGPVQTIKYRITLLDDIVISAGSNARIDYVSGNMLQGAFAKYLVNSPALDSFLQEVTFSNAYINGFQPIPFGFIAIKNDSRKCFSLSDGYVQSEKEQYVPVNGYYCIKDTEFRKATVKTATEYHYSTKGHLIFTYKKIVKGQIFEGSVRGPKRLLIGLRQLIDVNKGQLYLGGSSRAQYGRIAFQFGEEINHNRITTADTMIVELQSDVVIRDEYGAVTSKATDLIEIMRSVCPRVQNPEKDKSDGISVKTVTIGGYNAVWKLPIPQMTAFSKGSAIVLKNCVKGIEINAYGSLDEISFGGTGQYRIRQANELKEFDIPDDHDSEEATLDRDNTDNEAITGEIKVITDKIEENKLLVSIKSEALKMANEQFRSDISASAAMRVSALFQTNPTKEELAAGIRNNLQSGSNQALFEYANGIISSWEEKFGGSDDRLFRIYMKTYLSQIKRRYQQLKGGEAR